MAEPNQEPPCLDEFVLGPGDCNSGCGCRTLVRTTVGGSVPVLHDPNKLFVHIQLPERGGTKTQGVPSYTMTVTNPPDEVCRNPDGTPILVDGLVQRCEPV